MRPRIAILCNGSKKLDSYKDAVCAADGEPLCIFPDTPNDVVNAGLNDAKGILIAGGPDICPTHYHQVRKYCSVKVNAERDALDKAVVNFVLERRELPVLGICRGIQSLNVFAGGALIQDIPEDVTDAVPHDGPGCGATHEIEIAHGSLLAETVGCEALCVNSFHHQAVCRVAGGFREVARASDRVIEAIEREDARYCLGVQFHPERMRDEKRVAELFKRLVVEASSV